MIARATMYICPRTEGTAVETNYPTMKFKSEIDIWYDEWRDWTTEEWSWYRQAYDHSQLLLIKMIFNVFSPFYHPKIVST